MPQFKLSHAAHVRVVGRSRGRVVLAVNVQQKPDAEALSPRQVKKLADLAAEIAKVVGWNLEGLEAER